HDLPLIIAQAQLDEAPEVKIMCNLLECNADEVKIGMPLKMAWKDITEDRALPQWVPASSSRWIIQGGSYALALGSSKQEEDFRHALRTWLEENFLPGWT